VCPGPAAIANAVEARLGAHVLVPASSQNLAVEAYIEAHPPVGYRVIVAMSDADGNVIGRRELTSSEPDCSAITASAQLAIALMIDPEAHVNAAPSEPAPAVSATVAPPRAPPPNLQIAPRRPVFEGPPPSVQYVPSLPRPVSAWSVAVEGSANFTIGLLPGLATGARVQARLPMYDGSFALVAGANYYWPKTLHSIVEPEGAVATLVFQAAFVNLAGCVLSDAGRAVLGMMACFGADLGSMSVRTTGLDVSTGGAGAIADLEARARVMVRPARGFLVFAGGALRMALSREHFDVVNSELRSNSAFFRPFIGGDLEIGIGYEF
jgi:hypothetical protein